MATSFQSTIAATAQVLSQDTPSTPTGQPEELSLETLEQIGGGAASLAPMGNGLDSPKGGW